MPTIIFSPSAQLSQVDNFPTDCVRTVKGAIYVAPGRTSVVSDCEAAHLKKSGVPFVVVGTPLKPPTLPTPGRKPGQPVPPPTLPLPAPPAGPFGGLTKSSESEPEPSSPDKSE